MATATQQSSMTRTEAVEKNGVLDSVLDATHQAMLRPEFVQMRLENETIMAECRAHPRDYGLIKAELQSQLTAFPELASQCIYNKPVGRDGGTMKFARGLSIRAAELLAEAYGYCRVRSDVSPLDEFSVKIEATFTDYQRGRVWQDGGILSRRYKSRDGKMAVTPEDRFLNVVVKAEASKRIREATLRSVNAGLKAWFEDQCEKVIDGLLDDKTLDKIVGNFSTKGVSLEELEKLLGRPKSMGWTKEDRKTLIGVWNAVKDGETSIAELLAKEGAANDADANKARAEELKKRLDPKNKPPESSASPQEPAAEGQPRKDDAPAPTPDAAPGAETPKQELTEAEMQVSDEIVECGDRIEAAATEQEIKAAQTEAERLYWAGYLTPDRWKQMTDVLAAKWTKLKKKQQPSKSRKE